MRGNMRKDLQGFHSQRFSVVRLIVLLFLISLVAGTILPQGVIGQSIPNTANFTYFFPMIGTGSATPPVGPVGGTFTAIAIDPGQNDNLYAGHFVSGVYKSFDQGNTWYRKSLGLGILKIQSLATHPTSSAIVYAGTYEGGIYKSTNAGESWQASSGGVLNNHIIYDIEIDQLNPQRIFVASRINGSLRGYLARSMDGGANWNILLTGDSFSSLDYFYDVDIDPLNSNIIYLTAHQHGFYKSVDGGMNFYAINNGVRDYSARSFAIDIANAGLVFGGVWHGDGVYRTWNGGDLWARRSTGLPYDVEVFRVYLDPFGWQQKRLFSCTYGDGLYSTDDFGASWVSRGLAGQKLYDFVIADGNPQRWYAATENNGIFRSNTYGSNWNTIMGEMRLTDITGLTDLPGDPEALAGAVYGQGVYRITDAGETWQPMNEGISSLDVFALATAGEQLFAIGRGWMDAWNGETWQAVKLPEASQADPDAGLEWLRGRVMLPDEDLWQGLAGAVQPTNVAWQDDSLLLVTAGSGLWVMKNDEWQQVSKELPQISYVVPGKLPDEIENVNMQSLIFAESNLDVCLWAVGENSTTWVSKDCGENWTARRLDGTIQALAFDLLDRSVLIVGTQESGAFKIQVP